MDLDLYLRVLWRFRRLVTVGFVLAVVLAAFSFAKISTAGGSPKLVYRQSETWQSEAKLQVTQKGFLEGYATPTYQPDPTPGAPAVQKNDLARLSTLAVYWANLATTREVQRFMRHPPTKPNEVTVDAVAGPPFASLTYLPVISIKAIGTTAAAASALALDQTNAIIRYVTRNQNSAEIPVPDRVIVRLANPPHEATLIGKRGKTLPVIVFLAVMIAVLGLAFVLENLRPGIRVVSDPEEAEELPSEQARRASNERRRRA
jgi:hypothetical protein